MPYMIETTDRQLDTAGSANFVDFVRLKRNETVHRRELKPARPLPPQAPPPLPSLPLSATMLKFSVSPAITYLVTGT